MSKEIVTIQIETIIKEHNEHPDSRGHLVVDELFVPGDCVNFWVVFRPSLGKTAIDMGNIFRQWICKKQYMPDGSEGILNKFGKQVTIWVH